MAKTIYDDFLSKPEWLIEQKGWQRPLQQVREAHFTLGNGIVGSRGIMEELPYDANAGTYVSGTYDSFGAKIPELVNLPNPIAFRVDVSGEKLDPAAMDVLDHYRALDMKKGLLVRHTVYQTAHKKKIDYQSYRFVSMYQKFIGAMVISITPLDKAMTFTIHSSVDTSVCNKGVFTEGRKRHFEVTSIHTERNANYTEVKTFEHQHSMGYATCVEVIRAGKKRIYTDKGFNIKVNKGERITFIRYFTIVPSSFVKGNHLKRTALKELSRGRGLGVKRLFQSHVGAWQKLWNVADIVMEGSKIRQKAVRFNIYHLLIAGNTDDNTSVGARTLSGEGYRGHIFWDAESFILPFFTFINPKIAKSMLMYRWNRLDQARKIAAAKGYKGALFPWESAATGEETTPSWFKDLTGEVLKIATLEQEHHIVADIAFAVCQYVTATGDEVFMSGAGLEILLETARFWYSRMKYNRKMKRYEIHHAMGPDEFHKDVANNAFTNEMAKLNLSAAGKWYGWAKYHKSTKLKKLMKKLDLTEKEINKWREASEKIYVPYSKKKKMIEAFDGYFKLKDIRITHLDQHFMPVVPPSAHPIEEGLTKLVKQADVVMLLFMLYENYSLDEIERNYRYYESKTVHKSSLSPATHSIIAARIGDVEKALTYLTISLQADLLDVHGNAAEGFHAASGGGVWQTMVMGFGGMHMREDRLLFNPIIPNLWKSLSYKVFWQGALFEIKVLKNEIRIKRKGVGKKKRLVVEVDGVQKTVPAGKTVIFSYQARH
jgi:kojibiose phosphorylase